MGFPQNCHKKHQLSFLDGHNVSYRMSQVCLCAQMSVQKVGLVDKLTVPTPICLKNKLYPLLPTTIIRYLYFMCLKYKIGLLKIFHKKFK